MQPENCIPLVEVTRGSIVESIHFGAFAVVTASGKIVLSAGDPQTVTFLRSTAKPFQALPFIEMGGAEHFGLSDREVAILCASHSGSAAHLEVLNSIQSKVGITEADLLCGVHTPYDPAAAKELILHDQNPHPNQHNCSGKHSGMLAHAKLRHLPLADYINPEHPIQRTILNTFAEMCGLQTNQVELGIDGCSAPNFAVPLRSAAMAFARLCDPQNLPSARADACARISSAMPANPDMVGGVGRFDTLLMGAGKGMIISKGGAEGYQGIGLKPGALGPGTPALGFAMKISDGDDYGRAGALVTLEVLRRLGALSHDQLTEMAKFDARPLYNWRKLTVGEIRTCFK